MYFLLNSVARKQKVLSYSSFLKWQRQNGWKLYLLYSQWQNTYCLLLGLEPHWIIWPEPKLCQMYPMLWFHSWQCGPGISPVHSFSNLSLERKGNVQHIGPDSPGFALTLGLFCLVKLDTQWLMTMRGRILCCVWAAKGSNAIHRSWRSGPATLFNLHQPEQCCVMLCAFIMIFWYFQPTLVSK